MKRVLDSSAFRLVVTVVSLSAGTLSILNFVLPQQLKTPFVAWAVIGLALLTLGLIYLMLYLQRMIERLMRKAITDELAPSASLGKAFANLSQRVEALPDRSALDNGIRAAASALAGPETPLGRILAEVAMKINALPDRIVQDLRPAVSPANPADEWSRAYEYLRLRYGWGYERLVGVRQVIMKQFTASGS